MIIVRTVEALQGVLAPIRRAGKKIGFVPTMGALHAGHLSLIAAARLANQPVVCSIFVNPTQFNDLTDLAKYPRPESADIEMLRAADCDVLFLPSVAEIYPAQSPVIAPDFDLQGLDLPMEGARRPGHFAGVIQVVHRLLALVEPDFLYMGQKDFQQQAIIRRMIIALRLPLKLVTCPILRERNGLAMSSRNVRLSAKSFDVAGLFSQLLFVAKNLSTQFTPNELSERMAQLLSAIPEFELEYLSVVDAFSLRNVEDWEKHRAVVLCGVVRCEGVRLLDNIFLKNTLNFLNNQPTNVLF